MKRILALILTVVMVVALSSVATIANADSGSDKPVELKFAHIYPASSNENKWIQWICDEVAARSNGTLIIHNYSDSQLGVESEIDPQVAAGDLDLGLGGDSAWADAVNMPELGCFGLPYICTSLESLKNIGLNVLPDAFNELLSAKDAPIICMGAFSGGLRSVVANGPLPTCAADLKGLKLRVPEIDLYVKAMEALGCVPTGISWAETYSAVAQKVVDGLENDYSSIVSMNLQEVLEYCVETNHIGCYRVINMNKANFDALSEEHQQIMKDVFREACILQFDDREKDLEACKQIMIEAGMQFVELPESDIMMLREKCSEMWDKYREYGISDLIDRLAEAGSPQ